MVKNLLTILFILLVTFSLMAQDAIYKKASLIKVNGNEVVPVTENYTKSPRMPQISNRVGNIEFTITDLGYESEYDLQSNGTANEIIQDVDPSRNQNVHIYWMRRIPGNTVRSAQYLFTDDFGANWVDYGQFPAPPASGGFPTISLKPENGAAVIGLHTNYGSSPTRTQVFYDEDAGSGNFTNLDPGLTPDGAAIWPRIATLPGGKVVVISSISGADSAWTNYYDGTAWGGWVQYPGDQAETYQIAVSENGTVGMVYIGTAENNRSVLYRESLDGGASWTDSYVIYRWSDADSMGGLRGLDLAYIQNNPVVVFELAKVVGDSYFPNFPSKIMFWSPGINNDEPFVIADTNNVPGVGISSFNTNAAAVHVPICRPSIGVADDGRAIYVAFNASTNTYSNDSIAYYATWFMYSSDNGLTWQDPVRVTPETNPRKDWRFVNLSEKNSTEGNFAYVNMVIQARDTAGIAIQNGPSGAPAKLYYVKAKIDIPVSVEDRNIVDSFELFQNYPNPFNPSTNIKYSIAERSNVTVKVYNMLGSEVATLVNQVQDAGTYNVGFNASDLASGMYIYTIKAGNFTLSKKMMLLK